MDINASAVDRVFDYRIPSGMELSPGCRVRIPFGRAEKEGYVLALSGESSVPADKIRDVIAPLEAYPAILPALIALAEEMRETFRCTWSQALNLMLPAQMRGGRVRAKEEVFVRCVLTGSRYQEFLKALPKRAQKKRILMTFLGDGADHPLKDLRALVKSPLPLIRELSEAGALAVFRREVDRRPAYTPMQDRGSVELTDEQREVTEELLAALNAPPGAGKAVKRCFLLSGVTGSGKTEVYMRLARACLDAGKSVIVLVPEISLTAQMVDWFETRFGSLAAVLHSRLTPGERYDEWRRIRRGEARLVIGARSAVFAPTENLGAVIVDEEHEPSYFSESFPQYDARRIARSRAERENAVLLLGSATPSILSFAMARRGDYVLLEMPHRVNGRPMPAVSVVDMRGELTRGNRSIFSLELQRKLRQTLSSGQQAILFLNRRGYAPTVTCRQCGEAVKCRRCDVSMAYHRADGRLHCHYCGATDPLPASCPACGSASIRPVGAGTQKVEEELHKLFPQVRSLRMDMDTTQGHNAHQEIITAFRSRQAQVLIGTQMIAKGLDFPRVTLVGAILADLSLTMPDYRAAERTFQLLVQVAGRAGRAEDPGAVVIQTYQPDHYAIRAAVTQDYRSYFESEFARRRQQLYPPFTVIARFLAEAPSGEEALAAARAYEKRTTEYLEREGIRRRLLFIRTDEAPISYIENRHRAQVLMKLLNHPDTDRALAEMAGWAGNTENRAAVYFEVDPPSLA